jgi:hypothetical protein
MIKRWSIAALLIALALPMRADFNEVARAIDGYHGVKRVWMPGLSIARLLVWVIQPKGVHDFQIANFEGAGNIDPHELHALLQSNAGRGFAPMVRAWSRKSGEWSFIYARPHPNSDRIELLVLAHDREDTVLVRVDVDATEIAKDLNHPRSVTHYARQ